MVRDQRRLAAIVSADVAGYSRLMGKDDSGTLSALKAHRRELIDPKIAEYGGRIVKTTGDGLLLEFPSVVDAVRCAVDVQRGMATRNAGVPPDQRIDFRIGINVGDIIIDGDDIYGDGVNVAARVQALADPGGICASKVVRDQVLDKLSFTFEDLGPQQVKNISRPVEVYRVDLGSEALQTRSSGRRRLQRLTQAVSSRWLAVSVLALGIAGVGAWILPQLWKTAGAVTPPPLSVAILTFASPSGSAADEQFALALTRDLTALLARVHQIRLMSQGVAVGRQGHPIDARSVGRELGVRYLVDGEIRRGGDRIVVTCRVVDTSNAAQVWNGSVDLETAQAALAQDHAIGPLVLGLRRALLEAEIRRVDSPPGPGANAMEFVLYGQHLWRRNDNTASGALEARKYFDQALKLDPDLVPALYWRGWSLMYELDLDPRADHDRLVRELDELSNRALGADRSDPDTWFIRTEALWRQWRRDAALEANAEADRLDELLRPYYLAQRAQIMLFAGQPAAALTLAGEAIAIDPTGKQGTGWAMLQQCRAHLLLGRYRDAIAPCEKNASMDDWFMPHVFLVAAYANDGDSARAAIEKASLLRQRPGFSIADFKNLRFSDDPTYLQQLETHLFPGLRKAGIPEK